MHIVQTVWCWLLLTSWLCKYRAGGVHGTVTCNLPEWIAFVQRFERQRCCWQHCCAYCIMPNGHMGYTERLWSTAQPCGQVVFFGVDLPC
jgi:hypothetical protein